ncbi:MAG: flagellar motor switch protein FliN [Treponema sp.]|nr:flagellar motor switch protein FliN [Treponema sp.]
MSDGAISQDEIDALLAGVTVDGLNSQGRVGSAPSAHIDINALQKLANDLAGPLADNLGKMTGELFSSGNPIVETLDRDRLLAKLPETVIYILSDFSSGLQGEHVYILSQEFAQKIVDLMNKEENAAMDDMALSVIAETVSTHTNNEIQALEKTGRISGIECVPPISRNEPKALIRIPQNTFALFNYSVSLQGQVYTLWEVVSGSVAEKMGTVISGVLEPPMQGANDILSAMTMGSSSSMGGSMMGVSSMASQASPVNVPNVQSLQYPMLQGGSVVGEQGNIGLIMDVFMEMTVELGRTKKQIKDILGMGEGTIIELDKLAGEPVDILVNHKPIAKGEVVVIDENFGVRVTEILSSIDRVSDLH